MDYWEIREAVHEQANWHRSHGEPVSRVLLGPDVYERCNAFAETPVGRAIGLTAPAAEIEGLKIVVCSDVAVYVPSDRERDIRTRAIESMRECMRERGA